MNFNKSGAKLFIPDGLPEEKALSRTTHLAVAAHQDDIEIMAFRGILECFQQNNRWFSGVVVTNGSGSARDGVYQNYTDDDMRAVRLLEQKKAAVVGEYAAQALLDYPSSEIKDSANTGPVDDIVAILSATRPDVLYTHNLADKHETHIGVALRTIAAVRSLPANQRPGKILGCEVWRDLDWLPDEDKVALEVSQHQNLQSALLGIFDSQIAGGKRYDLATMGRRRAHATYHASHSTDIASGITFAMDLTPLASDTSLDPAEYANRFISRFSEQVTSTIHKLSGA